MPGASSYAIVANGFADGPAQALRDHLVEHGASVVTVFHPLAPEQGDRHVICRYAGGRLVTERSVRLGLRPPASFLLDPLVPPLPPPVDAWFGFNPLAGARGLVARATRRARTVVLWSVDFVPDRFGAGTLATRAYDRLDRLSCLRADARVELSQAARDARDVRHGLRGGHVEIVPMGAWVARVPTVPDDGHRRRRVGYLGHLVPRQGVETLLEALALLRSRGADCSADVVGGGPLEEELRARAVALGLGSAVRFHGFVPEHGEVERILAEASLAVAPYRPGSFTGYADPGKLKAYVAAGLPTVLTPVPPNAEELAREAGAELAPFDAAGLADAIARGLDSPGEWRRRRQLALAYRERFDWATLLPAALARLGLEPD